MSAMLRHRVTPAGPWCSGQTCQPVTLEIAGSNPVGPAITPRSMVAELDYGIPPPSAASVTA